MSGVLGARLRELRGDTVQPAVARALGVSVPLVSSWENGTVPPPARLEAYARLFCTPRSRSGKALRLLPVEELTPEEGVAHRRLLADLRRLGAGQGAGPADAESPFRFPPGQAVTIACAELPPALRRALPYADPGHPDHVDSYKYADVDALIELAGHVRAVNPANPVRIGVPREIKQDDRTAHLILLGRADLNSLTQEMLAYFGDVPVAPLPRRTETDVGGFTVRTETGLHRYSPKLSDEPDGRRTLLEDVALLLRAPNPFNAEHTLTICSGMYGRGSYAAVRALTDPKIRERNSRYLGRRFRGCPSYTLLCRVRVVAGVIITPNWTLDEFRLHEWPAPPQ